ncbi:MAG: phosphohydrolase [Gammaproteobacteria bacterium HGW-Gammaproteobacteria-3]|nr:MAG: phosphohydrolase [Gammaproteobacteria bacterium HGW-Gammaproteobacteria-3]
MNAIIAGIFSIALYSVSATLIAKETYNAATPKRTPLYLAWAAAGLHSLYAALIFSQRRYFNFGFFNTASLMALLVALLLLIAVLNKPVEKLGVIVFPLAAAMLGLDMLYPEELHVVSTHNWQMNTHILSSITAFSLLNIAALQAILLAIQNRQLRSHQPKRLIASLPPLQAMESLLFQMILLGLFFLSISLITGFLFIEDLFAQHLVHKTVLSIIAWLIFTGLLFGRIRYGWRGQTAVHWTLAGFVLLLLAYFGSKLVLELILNKV